MKLMKRKTLGDKWGVRERGGLQSAVSTLLMQKQLLPRRE